MAVGRLSFSRSGARARWQVDRFSYSGRRPIPSSTPTVDGRRGNDETLLRARADPVAHLEHELPAKVRPDTHGQHADDLQDDPAPRGAGLVPASPSPREV